MSVGENDIVNETKYISYKSNEFVTMKRKQAYTMWISTQIPF